MMPALKKYIPDCPLDMPRGIWFMIMEYAETIFSTSMVDALLKKEPKIYRFTPVDTHDDRAKKISLLAPDVQLMIKDALIRHLLNYCKVPGELRDPKPLIYYMATCDEDIAHYEGDIRRFASYWYLLLYKSDGYRFCDFYGCPGNIQRGFGIMWKTDELKYQLIFSNDDESLDEDHPYYKKFVSEYERRRPDYDSCECAVCMR